MSNDKIGSYLTKLARLRARPQAVPREHVSPLHPHAQTLRRSRHRPRGCALCQASALPGGQNIITSIRGSRCQVADIKSESRPASTRNRSPASCRNAWPASSESAFALSSSTYEEVTRSWCCFRASSKISGRIVSGGQTVPNRLFQRVPATRDLQTIAKVNVPQVPEVIWLSGWQA